MRLAIFGATGGTGRRLVEQALDAGHEVTAVVRDPARLPLRHDRLTVLEADVMEPAATGPAVAGSDAVLSALGPRRGELVGVCATGTASIIKAMQATGVRRIVVVSAAPVPDHDPGDGLLVELTAKPLLRRLFRDHYADMARMEEELRHSGLEWTVMRPPKLTNKPRTDRYRTALNRNVRGGLAIPRADLAAEMLRRLDDPSSVGATVGIAN